MRCGGRQQVQRAIHQRDIALGRDNVNTVDVHRHAILDRKDRHAGVVPNQLGKNTFVIRCQVLNENKSHAGVGVDRHAGEKSLKGSQPTGRSADADNREGCLGCWGRLGYLGR